MSYARRILNDISKIVDRYAKESAWRRRSLRGKKDIATVLPNHSNIPAIFCKYSAATPEFTNSDFSNAALRECDSLTSSVNWCD